MAYVPKANETCTGRLIDWFREMARLNAKTGLRTFKSVGAARIVDDSTREFTLHTQNNRTYRVTVTDITPE